MSTDGGVKEETLTGKGVGMSGGCRSRGQPGARGSTPAGKHLVTQRIAERMLPDTGLFASVGPHVVVATSICRLKSLVRISCSRQRNPYYFQQVF